MTIKQKITIISIAVYALIVGSVFASAKAEDWGSNQHHIVLIKHAKAESDHYVNKEHVIGALTNGKTHVSDPVSINALGNRPSFMHEASMLPFITQIEQDHAQFEEYDDIVSSEYEDTLGRKWQVKLEYAYKGRGAIPGTHTRHVYVYLDLRDNLIKYTISGGGAYSVYEEWDYVVYEIKVYKDGVYSKTIPVSICYGKYYDDDLIYQKKNQSLQVVETQTIDPADEQYHDPFEWPDSFADISYEDYDAYLEDKDDLYESEMVPYVYNENNYYYTGGTTGTITEDPVQGTDGNYYDQYTGQPVEQGGNGGNSGTITDNQDGTQTIEIDVSSPGLVPVGDFDSSVDGIPDYLDIGELITDYVQGSPIISMWQGFEIETSGQQSQFTFQTPFGNSAEMDFSRFEAIYSAMRIIFITIAYMYAIVIVLGGAA